MSNAPTHSHVEFTPQHRSNTDTQRIENPEQVIEAVYNINSHAKKYGNLGTKNYRRGKKATAKQNSVKKNALYTVKKHVIHGFVAAGECDRVEKHEINGTEFICHYFEFTHTWSFHTPIEVWDGPTPDCETKELPDFESTAEKTRSDLSLKESLLLIQEATGVNANDCLEQEYVSYGRNSYFTGWKYL